MVKNELTADEYYDATEALAELKGAVPTYTRYTDYYYGRHSQVLLSEKLQTAYLNKLRSFKDNLCKPVVNSCANRLHIEGWEGDDAAQQPIADLEARTHFEALQRQVHLEARIAGDAHLLVWQNEAGQATMSFQRAATCRVVYDPEDEKTRRLGIKMWPDRDRWRINIYTPDRELRAACKAVKGQWPKLDAFTLLDADPIVTHNWGTVPLYHFGDMSDLVDVIDLQDALNKNLVDMLVAAEFWALPLRVFINFQNKYDKNGNLIRPKVAPGTAWQVEKDGDVKQLPAADLVPFLEIQNNFRSEISRVSATPLHMLGMSTQEVPSGEALKVVERPLTDKVRGVQTAFEDTWAEAMTFALSLDGVTTDVKPLWTPAETITEMESLQLAAQRQAIGFSRRESLLGLGIASDKVDEMLADKANEAAEAAARQAQSFAIGGL